MVRRRWVSARMTEESSPPLSSEFAGEGHGEKTPTPRPHDSAFPTAVVELTSLPSSISIYPFGWTRLDLRRFVGLTLTAIVALVFLWYVQPILPPFLIAFFLAALFEPTVREIERHGRSRVQGILTVYALGISIVAIIAFIVVPRVINQASEISANMDSYSTQLRQSADLFLTQHKVQLERVGVKHTSVSQLMKDKSGPIQAVLTSALSSITSTLAGLASRALWLVIIPLTGFFFMRDYPVLRARIITQFPELYHERIDRMSREVMDVFSAYLRGLGKICSLYSIVAICLYSALGLRYSLILGLFAGIFYAVPYVGQLFTAIGTGSIAYLMEEHSLFHFIHLDLPPHSLVYTVGVVVIALIVQNVFDQILYPRIVGGSVGLHPVASIFALMAGATLFGIWGMLFAVPVAASLQIIIIYFFPKVRMAPSQAVLTSNYGRD